MSQVRNTVNFEALRERVKAGAANAVRAMALAAGSYIRESMPGPGASASDSKDRGTGQNDHFTPSTPGGPPGVRRGMSGGLLSTINEQMIDEFSWVVGTNSPYAKIHEFGGTIRNPGGTPYIVTDKGVIFIKKSTAERLRSQGRTVKVTKPHTIHMPARPFFHATIRARQNDLAMVYVNAYQSGFARGTRES